MCVRVCVCVYIYMRVRTRYIGVWITMDYFNMYTRCEYACFILFEFLKTNQKLLKYRQQ